MQTTEINVTSLCRGRVQRAPKSRGCLRPPWPSTVTEPWGDRPISFTVHVFPRVAQPPSLPTKDPLMASGRFQFGATSNKVVAVWKPA